MTITTRFQVGIFALLAAVPTLYAQSINPSQFSLKASEYNQAIEKLDEALGSRQKELGALLDTAPYMTARPSDEMYDTPWFIKGFQWNPYVSEDVKGEYWNPEGISTSYDAGYPNDIIPSTDGKPGNTGIVVVSWNDIRNRTGRASNPGEGVRVSFVRKGTAELSVSGQAYFNALLVEPFVDSKGNADFRPLRDVISGGIVWRKNWLYVTDRNLGLRVFDLDHIYQVGTGKVIGREDKGYYGGSYSYVIPQAL